MKIFDRLDAKNSKSALATDLFGLTIPQKNAIVDELAKGGNAHSIHHLCIGVTPAMAKQAMVKLEAVAGFIAAQAQSEEVSNKGELKDAVRYEFQPTCEVTALDYFVDVYLEQSKTDGKGDFDFWQGELQKRASV